MRGMTDFQSKHVDIYFIAREQMKSSKKFIKLIFSELNYWLNQPIDDITTKSFMKLLNYLRMMFF